VGSLQTTDTFDNPCVTEEPTVQTKRHCVPASSKHSYGSFRAKGVTRTVEHLPSKDEALSSNPSTTKKNKKKNMYFETQLPGFDAKLLLKTLIPYAEGKDSNDTDLIGF
jgi:hypothetical protein